MDSFKPPLVMVPQLCAQRRLWRDDDPRVRSQVVRARRITETTTDAHAESVMPNFLLSGPRGPLAAIAGRCPCSFARKSSIVQAAVPVMPLSGSPAGSVWDLLRVAANAGKKLAGKRRNRAA